MATTTILSLVLTALSILLGILYFTSSRRNAEMKDARAELKCVAAEQETLRERVAVMETTAMYLDTQLKALCAATDKKMDNIMASQKEVLAEIKTQLFEPLTEFRKTLNSLQETINDLRVKMAEKR